MKKIANLRENSVVSIAIGIFLIFIIITALFAQVYQSLGQATQAADISESLIRFHVVANSDQKEDQELKMVVRDKLIDMLKPQLETSQSLEQSRGILLANIKNIEEVAREEVQRFGKNYSVKASLDRFSFPAKSYGALLLPSGDYQALRVELGEAIGQNWWCVMFPPLCFVDISHGVVDEKTQKELLSMLTPEERRAMASSGNGEVSIEVRFKLLDMLKKSKNWIENIVKF